MSIKAIVTVLEHSKQRATALVVMLVLADFMNDYGEAWPAIDTLARKARADRSTVIDLLKKLEGEKELEVDRGRGQNGTNRYRLGDHYRLIGWESESPTPRPSSDRAASGGATSGGVGNPDGVGIRQSESDPILKEPDLKNLTGETTVNEGLGRKTTIGIPPGFFRCDKCGALVSEDHRGTTVGQDCKFHKAKAA